MGLQGGISESVIEKMDGVSASVIGLAVLLVVWIFLKSRHGSSDQKLKLPPGPPPLPIIGNLHIPATCQGKYVVYNSTDVGFAPYGAYWRKMRKVCLLELLSAKRIESMKFIREEEMAVMRESIMRQCGVNGSNPVNVSKVVSTFVTDIICRMTFGRKYSEETLTDSRGFKTMIQEDMLAAGTDTSSATLEWAMSELLLNPSMMKKAQDELQSVVGLNRLVEESDLPQLEYLQVVVKETLRLHPPGPLLIPHEAREDCIVGVYNIPKKARILVNVFAVGTDHNSWEDAEKFKPERFIGSPIDIKGQNFEVLPFGSGRRACPGQPLGTTVVEYALATLLHCFDWRLPDGMKPEDLSMTEEVGLSTPRAVHLIAVPTPRLPQP
eukprot:Gb_10643 [translate_table: standard]